ncbi:hypothetical protein BURPS668_0879 [Burkholderia pseudomallei 668]|nr:hypothetical protein BURPS668_0879 [Burkholderia pseudomallei 668]
MSTSCFHRVSPRGIRAPGPGRPRAARRSAGRGGCRPASLPIKRRARRKRTSGCRNATDARGAGGFAAPNGFEGGFGDGFARGGRGGGAASAWASARRVARRCDEVR